MTRANTITGTCSVCRSDERQRIELMICGGATVRSVATKFALNYHSVRRHGLRHISSEKRAALIAGPVPMSELASLAAEEGVSVLQHFRALRNTLYGTLDNAVAAGDRFSVASLAGRITEVLRELGRASGELLRASGGVHIDTANFFMNPQFNLLESELVKVLARHPEARREVIECFRQLETRAAPPAPRTIEGSAIEVDHAAA